MWMFFQVTRKSVRHTQRWTAKEEKQIFILFISIYVYLESYLCICSALLIVFMDGGSQSLSPVPLPWCLLYLTYRFLLGAGGWAIALLKSETTTFWLPQRTTFTSLKDAWTPEQGFSQKSERFLVRKNVNALPSPHDLKVPWCSRLWPP